MVTFTFLILTSSLGQNSFSTKVSLINLRVSVETLFTLCVAGGSMWTRVIYSMTHYAETGSYHLLEDDQQLAIRE